MRMHELVDQARGVPLVEKRTPMLDTEAVRAFVFLALGSGFVVFVGSGLIMLALGWTVKVAVGLTGAVVLATWGVFVVRVWQAWFQTETVRQPGQPEPYQVRDGVAVEVSVPEENRMQFLDLPGGAVELQQLASGVLNGRTFAEAEWTGAGALYSKSEFRELRGQLLERGLLCWRNDRAPSQGVELTRVGQAVFSRIAEQTRTHAHARGGGQFPMLTREEKGRGGDYARLT